MSIDASADGESAFTESVSHAITSKPLCCKSHIKMAAGILVLNLLQRAQRVLEKKNCNHHKLGMVEFSGEQNIS